MAPFGIFRGTAEGPGLRAYPSGAPVVARHVS